MRRRLLLRIVIATCAVLVAMVLADLWLRTKVGACGLTPFRTPTTPGIPYELHAGRTTTYKGHAVAINALGWRGPELAPPPPGTERIALIGDSVTFGNGCAEDDTLRAQLEKALARHGVKAQVVNCGIPGFSADDVEAVLRTRVVQLAPRRVVWIMVANDVYPATAPTVVPEDATIDAYAGFPLGSPLLQFVKVNTVALLRAAGMQLDGYVAGIMQEYREHGPARLRRALTAMKETCEAHGSELSVAIYPFLLPIDKNPYVEIEAEGARACAELGVPCTRLIEAFPQDHDLRRFWATMFDVHPNGAANALAVEKLAAALSGT